MRTAPPRPTISAAIAVSVTDWAYAPDSTTTRASGRPVAACTASARSIVAHGAAAVQGLASTPDGAT